MKTPPPIRLTLLPRDPAQPATTLHVDADGRITPGGERATGEAGMRTREIVAVPGERVRILQLEIPTRLPAQALAAARLKLEDQLAVDARPHVALAPPGDAIGAPRLVAVVDDAVMQTWRRQCDALGIVPDVMLPDCLLLQPPAEDALVAAPHDAMLLVRGADHAFTIEPGLAGVLAGERPLEMLDPAHVPQALAEGAARAAIAPTLDLLQFDHARVDQGGRRRGRRLAVLAALAALSPLVLMAAQTLRDMGWAHWMEIRADVAAVQHDPTLIGGADPAGALHARYVGRAAPVLLATHSTHLFDALAQMPDTHLDSYEFTIATGLRVGLVHAGEQDIETLRALLAPHGIAPVALDMQPVDGGTRSLVALEDLQ